MKMNVSFNFSLGSIKYFFEFGIIGLTELKVNGLQCLSFTSRCHRQEFVCDDSFKLLLQLKTPNLFAAKTQTL